VTWVSWRLQRTETVITAGILALLAALLVPTGITIAHAYHHDGLASCLTLNPSQSCQIKIDAFQSHYQTLFTLTNWFTLIPGLIGVTLAAPLILDLEHGTYRLAWTQSVTRGRWIAGKLALPVIGALLAGAFLVALMTWWHTPYVDLNGRLETGTYDTEGTVVLGYTLFALGLALAVGVIWRRAAAALTVAFMGYIAARIFVDAWLRARLVPPLTATWTGLQRPGRVSLKPPASLYHANIVSQSIRGRNGHGAAGFPFPGGHTGPLTVHTVYQPASHFWPLQLIETGLFAGIAVALILFAAWWTHQRTA
jgi:hypothetical protein